MRVIRSYMTPIVASELDKEFKAAPSLADSYTTKNAGVRMALIMEEFFPERLARVSKMRLGATSDLAPISRIHAEPRVVAIALGSGSIALIGSTGCVLDAVTLDAGDLLLFSSREAGVCWVHFIADHLLLHEGW